MIRAILFDLDGVLFNGGPIHYQALNRALLKLGHGIIEANEHIRLFNGLPTKKKLAMLVEQGRIKESDIVEISKLKQQYTQELIESEVKFDPEKYCLVAGLTYAPIDPPLSIGVVTNSIQKTARRVLEKMILFRLFDIVVTNEGGKPKPYPDLYQVAASGLYLSPKECIAIEDGHYGVEAALAAGCKVLRVNNPSEVTATKVWEMIKAWNDIHKEEGSVSDSLKEQERC